MPFENHGNRPFTATSVDKNAPAASGVYGISNARQWIYVGETANIQAELRKHLQHPNEALREHTASGYTYELSPAEYRVERQNQLISELAPVGNQMHRRFATARS
jgi:excinuclease UvrABC nuclease subunit